PLGKIRWRNERARVRTALRNFGLQIDPDAPVKRLREVERAGVAIVRALHARQTGGQSLLVLDEPTVYLPRDSISHLFEVVREVAASGTSILFVSHNLTEVRDLTNRVTVLRNGRAVAQGMATQELSEDQLIALIVGRSIGELYPPIVQSTRADSVLAVDE